jgi:membrane-associated protease RseP (regulator of RpoE activity)
MPKMFEVPIPIKIDKLTEIMRFGGVPVYVHWSVLLIAILILLNVIHHPATSLLGLTAYLGVLLIHESGHLIAAQRMRCEVFSIKLYPVFGVIKFEMPWSKFDHCVIAWGGLIAQAVVAIPVIGWVLLFGYTRFEALNAVLALLGFFSAAMAVFNLLPIPPLDGATAWAIIPEAIRRARHKSTRRSPPLR